MDLNVLQEMFTLIKKLLLIITISSGCLAVELEKDESMKAFEAEVKLAKVKILISDDDDLKFRFLVEGSKKYDFKTEYSLEESRRILKELQSLGTAEVMLDKFLFLNDDDKDKKRNLIRFIESFKFDTIIFTRASGHGSLIVEKYYKRPNKQNKTSLLTPDPAPVPAVMTATTSTRSRTLAPGQA